SATLRAKRCEVSSCCPPEVVAELVERFGPAAVVRRPRLLVLEHGLGEDHFGALADRLELDGDDALLATRRGEVVLLVPCPGEDQPRRRLDLQILARHG